MQRVEAPLVASEASDEGITRRVPESPGDALQKEIPDRMPEDVVDALELIEIDTEDGEAARIGRRLFDTLGEVIHECGSVR